MSDFLVGTGAALLLAFAYWLGWHHRGEQEEAMRNIDTLYDRASRRGGDRG